jgi:3'(2'), 5'-bisphosphate nucleotidase
VRDASALLGPVAEIARRAGEAILATRMGDGDVAHKDDGSPVTRADLAAQEVIIAGLRALEPDVPIVSEEDDCHVLPAGTSVYWLVDPLDGTKEFLKGLPEYTVNIALVVDGEPVLGVIAVPPAGRLYVAARGHGASRIEAGRAEPLAPRAVDRPRSAVVSRSHLSAETEGFLARLGIVEAVSRGSSLKLCAVAEGVADIYPRLGPTRLWDTAAGTAIARESGCAVVDLNGRPLRYDVAGGLTHAGFLACAPGGCLAVCTEALAAASSSA